jgi:cytochrome c peroxidase
MPWRTAKNRVFPTPHSNRLRQASDVFDRTCATCHVGSSGTDNNNGTMHAPADTGVDGAYAARTANKMYRTTPLRALWQHAP